MLAFGYTVMVAVARRGQPDQPVLRDLLRAAVGRLRAGLAALRAGVQGDQPGAHHQRGVREAHRQRPRPGCLRPTPSGSATGRPRSASTRSCGWSWSTRSRPSSGRCGCGARRTSRRCCSAARCSATPSTSTPTRSRSTPRWSRGCRCGAGAAKQLVVRSPLANLDTTPVRPGLVAVTAVLFGSTAFDSFKDSTRWVKFIQGDFVQDHGLTHAGQQPRAARLRARRGAGLHRRHDAHRRRARPAATGAARPVRALDRADRDRLRHRALPDLPARGRRADAHPT